ncbi:hypothetical protein C8246_03090 [Paracidovorax avenae]|nr:hypothetical protein C8246_03090 [Paracidovorax avenae]
MPAGRLQRAHVLQVACQVWRYGCRGGPAPEGAGGRECPTQEAAGRGPLGSRSPEDRLRGKALTPQDKRKAIARMLEHARISERRACRLAGLSRAAWRHPPQPGACTVRLRERIHAVAMQRRRLGYRRVHDMLRSEFPGTNHKKVYRLYREQGLAVRRRNKARKFRGERTPLVAAMRANQTWSLDFVSDALANGRRIKCLAITDDFTRECIDIAVDLSMPGAYVARVLPAEQRHRRELREHLQTRLHGEHGSA